MNVTIQQLAHQLAQVRANGLCDMIATAAVSAGIPLEFALAVASRETNMTNELGDGGHGVGIMQIDTQHAIAATAEATGTWRTDPVPLIEFGCAMLGDGMRWAAAYYPQFRGGADKRGWMKLAAAAYNAGQGNAAAGVRDHGDADRYTTGRDYGADVVARADALRTLLEETTP